MIVEMWCFHRLEVVKNLCKTSPTPNRCKPVSIQIESAVEYIFIMDLLFIFQTWYNFSSNGIWFSLWQWDDTTDTRVGNRQPIISFINIFRNKDLGLLLDSNLLIFFEKNFCLYFKKILGEA